MNDFTELDWFIDNIGYLIEEEDSHPAIVNPEKFNKFKLACDAAELVAHRNGLMFSYKQNEPYKSMGSIYIEGSSIAIPETRALMAIMRLADNTDIYPLSNGNIRMVFTFHNLATAIR